MNDALACCLVELTAGCLYRILRGCLVAGINGSAYLLDVGLELGTDGAITNTRLLRSADALFLRLDVCHVLTLSVMIFEATTLRHGALVVNRASIAKEQRLFNARDSPHSMYERGARAFVPFESQTMNDLPSFAPVLFLGCGGTHLGHCAREFCAYGRCVHAKLLSDLLVAELAIHLEVHKLALLVAQHGK